MSTSTPAAPGSPPVDSRRAAMEEERDFLIRSLHDLEAERAAGDIDEADYEALRDDYTVRAARLLRNLESPEPPAPEVSERRRRLVRPGRRAPDAAQPAPADRGPADRAPADRGPATPAPTPEPSGSGPTGPSGREPLGASLGAESPGTESLGAELPKGRRARRRPWARWQIGVAAAIVVILAGLVGWQVGHNSSARQAGQTITGGNTSTGGALSAQKVSQLLTQAESEAQTNPIAAIKAYNQVLSAYPDQPQALTEEAWIYAQGGELTQSQGMLAGEEKANPTYDPAYGYLGIVEFYLKDYPASVTQLTYYLGHGPDPALKAQATEALATAKIDALATASPATTPSGNSPPTSAAG